MNYCSRSLPLFLSLLSLATTAGPIGAQTKSDSMAPPPPTFQSGNGISPGSVLPQTRPFQGTGSRFPAIPYELPWMNDLKAAREAQSPVQSNLFSAGGWNGFTQNRVPVGTVLTGILETNISSDESKPGDIFSIRLEDGFFDGVREIVPRNSRIVGNVMSVVPAQTKIHGIPGNVQVSLQLLVFPDGRNTRIFGHIDHNANMDMRDDPADNQIASQLSYYPRAAASSLAMVGRTLSGRIIGIRPGVKAKGLDFRLVQGEVMAVKLNRSLDLNQLSPSPSNSIPPGMPINGGAGSLPSWQSPVTPGGGFKPFAVQPGGEPPLAPPIASQGAKQPPPADDPNKIFELPVGQRSKVEMPEPF